jgi:hypothetical protein
VRADSTASAVFTLALLPPMRADVTASAIFALAPLPPVRAQATAVAFFTFDLHPAVQADTTRSQNAALFTQALLSPMLALRSLPASLVAR